MNSKHLLTILTIRTFYQQTARQHILLRNPHRTRAPTCLLRNLQNLNQHYNGKPTKKHAMKATKAHDKVAQDLKAQDTKAQDMEPRITEHQVTGPQATELQTAEPQKAQKAMKPQPLKNTEAQST